MFRAISVIRGYFVLIIKQTTCLLVNSFTCLLVASSLFQRAFPETIGIVAIKRYHLSERHRCSQCWPSCACVERQVETYLLCYALQSHEVTASATIFVVKLKTPLLRLGSGVFVYCVLLYLILRQVPIHQNCMYAPLNGLQYLFHPNTLQLLKQPSLAGVLFLLPESLV